MLYVCMSMFLVWKLFIMKAFKESWKMIVSHEENKREDTKIIYNANSHQTSA
jgi:predicted choloylglycine hydrolase